MNPTCRRCGVATLGLVVACLQGCVGGPRSSKPSVGVEDVLPARVVHEPTGIAMVRMPAGEFWMGRPADSPDVHRLEKRHRRVISRPFYIAECETTVAEFRRFVAATGYVTDAERGVPEEPDKTVGAFAQTPTIHMRDWDARAQWRNPFSLIEAYRLDESHPVVQVSWNDARAFCEWAGLDLPTDAQWEYAARDAGRIDGALPWGTASAARGRANLSDASTRRAFAGENGFVEWDDGWPTIGPVRANAPSASGLYEMFGNVEEWTGNAFEIPLPRDGLDERAPGPRPGSEDAVALRGGCWFGDAGGPGIAERFGMRTFSRRDFIGFRVCVAVDEAGTLPAGLRAEEAKRPAP